LRGKKLASLSFAENKLPFSFDAMVPENSEGCVEVELVKKWMRGKVYIFVILMVFMSGCGGSFFIWETEQDLQDIVNANQLYRLGPHDVVALTVFGEPDLTKEMEVNGIGKISIPLLGELDIGGKTLKEADALVTAKLKDGYLKDPKVTFSITRYRNFYVHGEVNHPGAFPYQTGLTVLKAITHAGGFTDRAARSGTKVIRMIDGKAKRLATKMETYILPDDIVMIPESFF